MVWRPTRDPTSSLINLYMPSYRDIVVPPMGRVAINMRVRFSFPEGTQGIVHLRNEIASEMVIRMTPVLVRKQIPTPLPNERFGVVQTLLQLATAALG
jgi:hypothetical protein